MYHQPRSFFAKVQILGFCLAVDGVACVFVAGASIIPGGEFLNLQAGPDEIVARVRPFQVRAGVVARCATDGLEQFPAAGHALFVLLKRRVIGWIPRTGRMAEQLRRDGLGYPKIGAFPSELESLRLIGWGNLYQYRMLSLFEFHLCSQRFLAGLLRVALDDRLVANLYRILTVCAHEEAILAIGLDLDTSVELHSAEVARQFECFQRDRFCLALCDSLFLLRVSKDGVEQPFPAVSRAGLLRSKQVCGDDPGFIGIQTEGRHPAALSGIKRVFDKVGQRTDRSLCREVTQRDRRLAQLRHALHSLGDIRVLWLKAGGRLKRLMARDAPDSVVEHLALLNGLLVVFPIRASERAAH